MQQTTTLVSALILIEQSKSECFQTDNHTLTLFILQAIWVNWFRQLSKSVDIWEMLRQEGLSVLFVVIALKKGKNIDLCARVLIVLYILGW